MVYSLPQKVGDFLLYTLDCLEFGVRKVANLGRISMVLVVVLGCQCVAASLQCQVVFSTNATRYVGTEVLIKMRLWPDTSKPHI